jgi:hypothetical protein
MPGVTLQFHYAEGGKSQTVGSYAATTDASGHFDLEQRMPKKRSIENITAFVTDSGHVERRVFGSEKNMEILFQ